MNTIEQTQNKSIIELFSEIEDLRSILSAMSRLFEYVCDAADIDAEATMIKASREDNKLLGEISLQSLFDKYKQN
jgi:hypothetical protein